MSSEKQSNQENNTGKVVDVDAEERVPAVNTPPSVVEMLREAIERAAENERRRIRRDVIIITSVILLFTICVAGVFSFMAYRLIVELNAERDASRQLIISAMEQAGITASPDENDIRQTLFEALEEWNRETPRPYASDDQLKQDQGKTITAVTNPAHTATHPESRDTSSQTAAETSSSPQPAPTNIKTDIADLDAELEIMDNLIQTNEGEDKDLLLNMLAERDKALEQLRAKISLTHEAVMNNSRDISENPPEENISQSKEQTPRYINMDAGGMRMKILAPTP